MSKTADLSYTQKNLEVSNRNKKLPERHPKGRKPEEEIFLSRKIKAHKPWQPRRTFRLDRQEVLGTRLKGEIYRRPDRPYSEISLLDDTTYEHFDHFENFETVPSHTNEQSSAGTINEARRISSD